VLPKGEKIPQSLADFEALIRNEENCQRVNVREALVLLNDQFVTTADMNRNKLDRPNFYWDETADRVELNSEYEDVYYIGYQAISTFNLIIEHVPNSIEATEAEKNMVWAQAKVLRAMTYFNLANYYADTYDAGTASTKLSVPLITSADINAPYQQVSIQEIYDFMLQDMEEALPYIPKVSATPLHPNLGTAYAFYARLYLQMGNYSEALAYANKALSENDALYDWTAYYSQYQSQIEDPASYTTTESPMDHNYIENYDFRHGSNSSFGTLESKVPVERATLFESGDARFLSSWKIITVGNETYYQSTLNGYFNLGGITTVELYLIKAECLARNGDVDGAMDLVNDVRKTRILGDYYQDLSAANKTEAIHQIITTKRNELILTLIPFCDIRRLNNEGIYSITLSKVYNGNTISLSPDSHMWTMPFPLGAIENPGNGTFQQNVDR
jgi:tetratricopeptide (TPR) repeat protein